ncbi:M20/M25/M40 family metallo-hydrolase [Cellulomonas citrea]|uniref:M20/M25/M40 family metallo-hydrolase n=1 Tax=Cellulomonas citrea TaxID=1909423 RepID=UPI00135905C7|nr:M20/M25/M40 family metallo-hydrolase [Cellulomonas citrea]
MSSLMECARQRADEDVERLIAWAQVETPTGDRAALDGFASRVAAEAGAYGATSRRVPLPQGDVLVVEVAGRGPLAAAAPAVLLAHHDTVHAVGSLTGAVPLHRDGDVLHGPGVFDMKGGLVAALSAFALLAGHDHRPVRLLLTPDEEIGSPSSAATVVAQATGAAYVLGLEPPHPDGALKTSRMGSTRWQLAVTGRASHAALDPGAGINAIDELTDQLLTVRALTARYPQVLANVGVIDGGGRTNVVPDAARAVVGLRFLDQETETAVLAELADLTPVRPGALVAPSVLTRRPAWGPSQATDTLLASVVAAGAHLGQEISGRAATGAADTNLTGGAGIPSLDGFGPVGAGAHAVTEHVLLSSITQRAALLAAVLSQV